MSYRSRIFQEPGMKVEGAGRTTNRRPPGLILVLMLRMRCSGHIAARLLTAFHLLLVGVGLIGCLAVAAAALVVPISRRCVMTRMDGGCGLRGNRGCGRNDDCGDKHFHCSFSKRMVDFKLLETFV